MNDDVPTDGNNSDPPVSQGFDWGQRAGPIFKAGLAVGFLLLISGWALRFSPVNWAVEIFIICSGLAIILGAFGSTACVTVPGQSKALVGVAAIAVSIFFVIMNQMADRYVHLRVSGDVGLNKIKAMRFSGDQVYAGGFQESQRTWDFYVFGSSIKAPKLSLFIEYLDGGKERPFDCIAVSNIVPFLSSTRTIQWSYNEKKDTLRNVETGQLVTDVVGECPDVPGAQGFASSKPDASGFNFFPRANAAEADVPSESISTLMLIKQLNSEGTDLRRSARAALGNKGQEVVQPLVEVLSEDNLSYRTRLGVLVALAQASRKADFDLEKTRQSLAETDIERLLSASTDSDPTVRVYASEFLYRVADPRAIEPALVSAANASLDGKYNLLLIVKSSLSSISSEQKKDVAGKVSLLTSEGSTKTNKIISDIKEMAK